MDRDDASSLNGLPALLERLAVVVRRLPAPGELSLTTAATLRSLERLGPARLSVLARREAVTQPGMTQLVARLERAGLAERRPDPDDGRAVQVTITPAGRDLLARRRLARSAQVDGMLAALDDVGRARLAAALPALAQLAELGEHQDVAAVPA